MSKEGLQEKLTPKRTPGDSNIQKWGFDLQPHVSLIAGGVIIIFIALTLIFQAEAKEIFEGIQEWIATIGGWFYILVANIYLGVTIIFAFSKFGKIRLGGQDARPEFSTFAWFAMLLSAGMGIGLMFWSVAEPISHLMTPPFPGVEAATPEAAELAMSVTYFHWGLHAWGIYALVALALAFFAFNRGLPLSMRSVFHPLLGERIYDGPGHAIDILSVIATLFGLATSLGFGVMQVNAGVHFLIPAVPNAPWVQVTFIAFITGCATLSVVAGLDNGVRILSELNLRFAAVLMLFILLVGPTLYVLNGFVQNLGQYIANFPVLSFWTESYERTDWQHSWTVFYWGWWISWSPFVGTFIARVSRGRTVRQFVLGVLIVPSLLSFLWLAVFGDAAIFQQLSGVTLEGSSLAEVVVDDGTPELAMFTMFANFPLTGLISLVGIFLVTIFFVTSSDSGSLVVDNLTSGGKLDSPVPQRIFWAVLEGVVAAVLLIGGGEQGLTALQTAAITTGLPFSLILLLMCFSLNQGLNKEFADLEATQLRAKEQSKSHQADVPAKRAHRE
jgi:choline/glycine/proline betaine transport protein